MAVGGPLQYLRLTARIARGRSARSLPVFGTVSNDEARQDINNRAALRLRLAAYIHLPVFAVPRVKHQRMNGALQALRKVACTVLPLDRAREPRGRSPTAIRPCYLRFAANPQLRFRLRPLDDNQPFAIGFADREHRVLPCNVSECWLHRVRWRRIGRANHAGSRPRRARRRTRLFTVPSRILPCGIANKCESRNCGGKK